MSAILDILIQRRLQGNWTVTDIARADGDWTGLEVACIEQMRNVSQLDTARYLGALNKLKKEARCHDDTIPTT